jgi:hypothetical protein
MPAQVKNLRHKNNLKHSKRGGVKSSLFYLVKWDIIGVKIVMPGKRPAINQNLRNHDVKQKAIYNFQIALHF